ncbi:plastocyanin/azurin family copper-binding protein [Kitasatospora sp. NPDC127111]|uniref:plastocyanin/azurin family copper-binding protein n=1 Tax=Kitasatospora sp. NPDC127111 TaxID=3345363 RepID=UPI0036439C5A
MSAPRLRGGRLVALLATAAVALGIATTGLLAAAGAFRGPASAARCTVPALPGRVVDVTTADMGRGMMGGAGPYGMGMMRLSTSPAAVGAGTVSLRVFNAGARPHEVVVLPLPAGQATGQRAIGADGEVDESGAVGEASRSCGADSGDGIASGATGWTTLTMQPGRYELLCNLPWHYAAGMYAELDVTGR